MKLYIVLLLSTSLLSFQAYATESEEENEPESHGIPQKNADKGKDEDKSDLQEEKGLFPLNIFSLTDDNFINISKYLDVNDIVNLTIINPHFNDFVEKLFQGSVENKFFTYEEGRYNGNNEFFPKQFSSSWKSQAFTEHLLRTSPSAHNFFISFEYLENNHSAFKAVVKSKESNKTFKFNFELTSQIRKDIERCLSTVSEMGNKLVGENIDNFLDFLSYSPSVVGIELPYHNMEVGIEMLCAQLAENKLEYLQILDLRANSLTNFSAFQISTSISSSNTKILALNLRDNYITDIGAGSLSMMLGINTSIKEFDLSYNYLGKNGKRVIKDIWKAPNDFGRSIENLILRGNQEIKDKKDHYFTEELTLR